MQPYLHNEGKEDKSYIVHIIQHLDIVSDYNIVNRIIYTDALYRSNCSSCVKELYLVVDVIDVGFGFYDTS